MDELDQRITQALRADEAEQFAKLEPDLPPWEMMFETYKGRNRWLTMLASLWMVVFMAVVVWSVFRFFGTDDIKASLGWGMLAMVLFQGVGFLKMWWFMEMQKNSIIREVKRVELQVASLASRTDG
jgi:hypothetical protein